MGTLIAILFSLIIGLGGGLYLANTPIGAQIKSAVPQLNQLDQVTDITNSIDSAIVTVGGKMESVSGQTISISTADQKIHTLPVSDNVKVMHNAETITLQTIPAQSLVELALTRKEGSYKVVRINVIDNTPTPQSATSSAQPITPTPI